MVRLCSQMLAYASVNKRECQHPAISEAGTHKKIGLLRIVRFFEKEFQVGAEAACLWVICPKGVWVSY